MTLRTPTDRNATCVNLEQVSLSACSGSFELLLPLGWLPVSVFGSLVLHSKQLSGPPKVSVTTQRVANGQYIIGYFVFLDAVVVFASLLVHYAATCCVCLTRNFASVKVRSERKVRFAQCALFVAVSGRATILVHWAQSESKLATQTGQSKSCRSEFTSYQMDALN